MPTAISWRQVSATMAGDETTWGTPPAFTLMPTTSPRLEEAPPGVEGRRLAGQRPHPAVHHLAHDVGVDDQARLVEAARGAE